MAFDRIFAAAYIDNGNVHKVLGVKLRPFCAWHLFLLQVSESPFLDAGTVYLYHLRRAAGICCLRFGESKTRLPLVLRTMNSDRFHVEVEKFLLYMRDYMQRPDYAIVPPDQFSTVSRPSHTKLTPPPEVVQLVYEAAKGANISVNQAWEMPLGQAYISQAMYYRDRGAMVDFMDESEREFQAKLKKHIAEQEAKKQTDNGTE